MKTSNLQNNQPICERFGRFDWQNRRPRPSHSASLSEKALAAADGRIAGSEWSTGRDVRCNRPEAYSTPKNPSGSKWLQVNPSGSSHFETFFICEILCKSVETCLAKQPWRRRTCPAKAVLATADPWSNSAGSPAKALAARHLVVFRQAVKVSSQ